MTYPPSKNYQAQINRLSYKGYLSHEHVEQTTTPCPLAFLSSDVSHRDPIVRNTYTKTYKNMLKLLTRLNTTNPSLNRKKLMAVTAMMIGGVAIETVQVFVEREKNG